MDPLSSRYQITEEEVILQSYHPASSKKGTTKRLNNAALSAPTSGHYKDKQLNSMCSWSSL